MIYIEIFIGLLATVVIMLLLLGISLLRKRKINANKFAAGYDVKTEEEYKKHAKISSKMEMPLWKNLVMVFGGGITAGLLTYSIVGKWWTAGIAFLAGFIVPRLWYGWHMKSQTKLISAQMEQAMEIMAAVLKSSGSLVVAIEKAANEIGDPVRRELLKTASQIRLGMSTSEAFINMANRIHIPEMLILSIGIDLQSKGMAINLPSMLLQVQKNIRYRQLFQQDINTITAENKMAAYIVASIPFILVAAMRQIAPTFIAPLFDTTVGLVIFACCTLVILGGIYWINNMIEALKS